METLNHQIERARRKQSQHHVSEPRSFEPDFDAVVAPLEAAAGDTLDGPGRDRCLALFVRNPDVFQRLAAKALKRSTRNPVGLLIYMVRKYEDRFAFDFEVWDDAAA